MCDIIKMKEGIFIINISKEEAKYLRDKGLGYFINHTYTRYKHYFLVEDKKAMKALNKYRENIISYSKFA